MAQSIRCLFYSLVILLSYFSVAQAVTLPHLYEVSLNIETQLEKERQALYKQGLLQVLERIAGLEVAENQVVKQALPNAANFVEQFSYEENGLVVKYSPILINRLVQQMGVTTWGERRPSVLLWLAIEEAQQRHIVGAESEPVLHEKCISIANQKGLPLILPLMDLEDISVVTVADVWGQFPSVLQQASLRYQPQAILVAKIVHHEAQANEGFAWEGSWQLLSDSGFQSIEEESLIWRVKGQTLDEILNKGITHTSQHLIKRYGVNNAISPDQNVASIPPPDMHYLVGIQDIKSAVALSKVEAYLQQLDQVSKVNISQVFADSVIFEVIPRQNHDHASLAQAISLDHRLLSSIETHAFGEAKVDFVYRWIP